MTDQASLQKQFEPAFIPPSRRYRLYFDETGTGDIYSVRKDSGQQYLSLTGVVIRQDVHDTTTTQALTQLKSDIFGNANSTVVLHRREIIDKEGVFSVLENNDLRAKFDAAFRAQVEALPGPVFTVSIDKLEHLDRYKTWQFNPYYYVMTCLLERFVLWLYRTSNLGDVVGEARNPTHDAQLRRAFRRFYKHGTTVFPHVIRAKLISGELKLEPKTTNVAGLQIADLLAHPAHRTFKFERLNQPIPNDYGASLASILIRDKYDRNPKNQKIVGYGRKWLP